MNKAELIQKLEDIEWEDFEVKAAKDAVPKSSWETVSAFSNTAGGWLVFGIHKHGKNYDVIGVSNPEKIEQDFTTTLRGTKFNRTIEVTSKKYDLNGHTVLAFYIPQRVHMDKPIYYNSQKNTFIRTGSGDQRATQEEIDSFYRESSFSRKDGRETVLSINALDPAAVDRFRNYIRVSRPEHRYNFIGTPELLEKLGIIKDDKVTYGGLLLFGSEDEIQKMFTDFRVEYLEVPGISYEDGPARYSYRLSSEANLIDTYFSIFSRLSKFSHL